MSLALERRLRPLPLANQSSDEAVISMPSVRDYALLTPEKDNPLRVRWSGGLTRVRPFYASGHVKKHRGPPYLSARMAMPTGMLSTEPSVRRKGAARLPGKPDEKRYSELLDPVALLIHSNQHLKVARTTTLHCRARLEAESARDTGAGTIRHGLSYRLRVWILELEDTDASGDPLLRLQYLLTLQRRRSATKTQDPLHGVTAGTLYRQDQYQQR